MSDTEVVVRSLAAESPLVANDVLELIRKGAKFVEFDADHTLFSIEGIDEMARLRGQETVARVSNMTKRGMSGTLDVYSAYQEKFAIVQPDKRMVAYLGQLYEQALDQDAITLLKTLHKLEIGIGIISGGFEKPIRMALTKKVPGIQIGIRANQLKLNTDGTYAGFNQSNLVAHQRGKRQAIQLDRNDGTVHGHVAMVGDGATDQESYDPINGGADSFIKFTKHTNRYALNASIETNDYSVLLVLLAGHKRWQAIYRGSDPSARQLLMRGMLTILADTTGTTPESMDKNGYVEFHTDDHSIEDELRGRIFNFLQKQEGLRISGKSNLVKLKEAKKIA